MKIVTTLILVFFTTLSTFGQVGLINDKDGFTNVRKGPSSNSEIIYKLNDWEVFFIDIDYLDLDSSWIKIWIAKNKYSIYNGQPNSYDFFGFIHKSRIKLLDSLPLVSDTEVYLDFKISRADTNKTMDTSFYTINGQVPQGLEIPLADSYEVDSLRLLWKGQKIPVKKELFQDLYNVSFQEGYYNSKGERFKTYLHNDRYYIEQSCADGAGFYMVVWVIENGEIIQRLAGTIN